VCVHTQICFRRFGLVDGASLAGVPPQSSRRAFSVSFRLRVYELAQRLTHTLHSLVRVSRRGDFEHFVCVLNARLSCEVNARLNASVFAEGGGNGDCNVESPRPPFPKRFPLGKTHANWELADPRPTSRDFVLDRHPTLLKNGCPSNNFKFF
jgi:hypothetical protein